MALSKCDAIDAATLEERAESLKKAAKKTPLILSAVSGQGVKDALYALGREIGRGRKQEAAAAEEPKALAPLNGRRRPPSRLCRLEPTSAPC